MRGMDWKLEVVVIPVADVDRAKRFYAEQVGFAVDVDTTVGPMRIVQLTPPGSGCSITLMSGRAAPAGPGWQLQLVVADIEAAHAELVERGVGVSGITHFEDGVQVEGRGEEWNSFLFFSDPDGNAWAVQERPPRT